MPGRNELPSVHTLREKIRAARQSGEEPAEPPPSGASMAFRLGTELVAGVTAGTLIGYGLDMAAGTLPLFLILCMLFGTVAGMLNLYRTNQRFAEQLEEYEKTAESGRQKSAENDRQAG